MEKKINIILILVAVTLGVSVLSYVVLLASGGYISLFRSDASTGGGRRNIGNDLRQVEQAPTINIRRPGTGGFSGIDLINAKLAQCKTDCAERCSKSFHRSDSDKAKDITLCRASCDTAFKDPEKECDGVGGGIEFVKSCKQTVETEKAKAMQEVQKFCPL